MTFQLYIELITFLALLLFGILLPYSEIAGILITFLIFVVQPLFYLNGDVNFRNRVQNQGLWKALKKELFQMNWRIQTITFYITKCKNSFDCNSQFDFLNSETKQNYCPVPNSQIFFLRKVLGYPRSEVSEIKLWPKTHLFELEFEDKVVFPSLLLMLWLTGILLVELLLLLASVNL